MTINYPDFRLDYNGPKPCVPQPLEVPTDPVLDALLDEEERIARKDEPTVPSHRAQVLKVAEQAILKERNNSYGPPHQDFSCAATLASTLLGRTIEPHEIALIQICVKLSRSRWSPDHMDHWVDIAGYAACGYEAFIEERHAREGVL